MANYNRVIMIGNLTRDPQLSYLPSQTPVVEFGLASNRRWRGQDGSQRDETCFIDCRAYGRIAETINRYCRKGRPLMVEGRLTFDQWEGSDGSKRSKHRITVENFTFLDSRDAGPGRDSDAAAGEDGRPNDAPPAGAARPEDDIPF
ncbi:MAG: single-stranded DNA-binding protein [Sedimentisphaerales bacterium]|nr:single-stranded DNA-binding protein [Sedimentisphaerales bacterium]